MADEDRSLEIGVKTTADNSGVKDTQKEISNLTSSNNQAAKSFIRVESAVGAFRKLLRAVTREVPLFGFALRFALNPVVALLMGGVAALKLYQKHLEDVKQAAEEVGRELAQTYITTTETLAKLREQSEEAHEHYEAAMRNLDTAQQSAENRFKRTTEEIKHQKEAAVALAEFLKKGEIDKAAKSKLELEAEKKVLDAKEKQLKDAKAREPQLKKEREEAALVADDHEVTIMRGEKALDRLNEKYEKQKELVEALKTKGAIGSLFGKDVGEEQSKLFKMEDAIKDQIESTRRERALSRGAKTKLSDAEAAVLANRGVIAAGESELPGMRREYGINNAKNVLGTAPMQAAELAKAADAMAANRRGGGDVRKLTQDQRNTLIDLDHLLTSLGVNNSTMIWLIEKSAGDAEQLAQRLKALESRLQNTVR